MLIVKIRTLGHCSFNRYASLFSHHLTLVSLPFLFQIFISLYKIPFQVDLFITRNYRRKHSYWPLRIWYGSLKYIIIITNFYSEALFCVIACLVSVGATYSYLSSSNPSTYLSYDHNEASGQRGIGLRADGASEIARIKDVDMHVVFLERAIAKYRGFLHPSIPFLDPLCVLTALYTELNVFIHSNMAPSML
jgi:hypothetical protein